MSTTPTAPAALAPPASGSWRTRDLINVGIFTALYYVVTFITGMVGFFGPGLMFLGWALGVLFNGIVIALFLARTPRIGALTLLSGIVSALFVLTGHSVLLLPFSLAVGFGADLVVHALRHRPALGVPLGYGVLSLWMVGPLLPILLNAEEYYRTITEQMGAEYATSMSAIFQPWVIGVWAVTLFVLGLLGGLLGVRVGRRHFSRAGLA